LAEHGTRGSLCAGDRGTVATDVGNSGVGASDVGDVGDADVTSGAAAVIARAGSVHSDEHS
jgi:hypothetical protein